MTSPHDPGAPVTPHLTPEDVAFRLRFLEMDERDAQVLRSMLPKFHERQQELVDTFYRHLRAFPFTAGFLQDPERFERLQTLQRNHLKTLLEAQWGPEFALARKRVGDAHAEVGIEPQYFIGAYFQYVQHCLLHYVGGEHPELARQWCAQVLPLLKAVFLDVGLTLDAYFQQSTQKVNNALEMLWKANQELRQFAHLTTHDLKTPLATVANLCEETLDEFGRELPEEARKMIDSARQRVFRMSAMIDELLATALATESTERQEAIDLARIVAEVVDRLRPSMLQKHLTLKSPQKWPKAWGNAVRLREALYNIVSNAVKYTPPVKGHIELSHHVDGNRVRIGVADNGPGIPKEDQKRVFTPFRRLAMHHDQPGSGLGLYFAKNLVEALGGRVWVESELGRGSVFYIELETAQSHEAPAETS